MQRPGQEVDPGRGGDKALCSLAGCGARVWTGVGAAQHQNTYFGTFFVQMIHGAETGGAVLCVAIGVY